MHISQIVKEAVLLKIFCSWNPHDGGGGTRRPFC